jgi:hypothetical protein
MSSKIFKNFKGNTGVPSAKFRKSFAMTKITATAKLWPSRPFCGMVRHRRNDMGTVYAEITLKNSFDVSIAREGSIPKEKVRETTVRALIDTGVRTLVINEELRQKLGLQIRGQRKSILADGGSQVYQVTEPVNIHWKDRETSCRALVVP